MSYFIQIYELAKHLCNSDKQAAAQKELSLLLLKPNAEIDDTETPWLTPAAALARDGYINEAFILHKLFNARLDKIYYGAIIGGHFNTLKSVQEDFYKRTTIALKENTTIFMALAQMGYEQEVISFLEKLPKELKQEFMNAALKGATLGKQKKLLQILENQCIDSIYFSFCAVLLAAAWLGDVDFILILSKKYTSSKASSRESLLDLQKEVMGGLASVNREDSIRKLITEHQYPLQAIGSAVVWAATYKHYDLAITLAVEYSLHKKLLEISHWDFKLLEILLSAKDLAISDKDLEVVLENAAHNGEHFIRWIANAVDTSLFERLLKIAKNLKIDDYLITRARSVFKLKREFGLEVEQAFFLELQYSQIMPIIESKIDTQEEMMVAIELKNKLNAQLNQEQTQDMVERLVQNKYRPRLIQKIEKYISSCSRFFSSHQDRATSFLNKLTQVNKASEFQDLVISQYRLFHVKADSKVKSSEKYLKPIKNQELKDEYYIALEEYFNATQNIKKF